MSSTSAVDKAEKGMVEEEQPNVSSTADDMAPTTAMVVKTSTTSSLFPEPPKRPWWKCCGGGAKVGDIAGYQKLVTELDTRKASMNALRLAIFASK